jgi:surface protein
MRKVQVQCQWYPGFERNDKSCEHVLSRILLHERFIRVANWAGYRYELRVLYRASSFTSDLSAWQTGQVTDMSGMFRGARLFDGMSLAGETNLFSDF